MSLDSKILFIQSSVDEHFRLILDSNWKSSETLHRHKIREFLGTQFSAHFSREQLAQLNDLNWLPQASDGFFSISHCKALGGFSYSQKKHGFDAEETKRISLDILKRTCPEAELAEALRPEFLWVAKEAGFKALSAQLPNLVITDLICTEWNSHFENQVFSFRLKSEKTLDFGLNKGFIFLDENVLYSIYFQ